jgi:hypothetical protein
MTASSNTLALTATTQTTFANKALPFPQKKKQGSSYIFIVGIIVSAKL